MVKQEYKQLYYSLLHAKNLDTKERFGDEGGGGEESKDNDGSSSFSFSCSSSSSTIETGSARWFSWAAPGQSSFSFSENQSCSAFHLALRLSERQQHLYTPNFCVGERWAFKICLRFRTHWRWRNSLVDIKSYGVIWMTQTRNRTFESKIGTPQNWTTMVWRRHAVHKSNRFRFMEPDAGDW